MDGLHFCLLADMVNKMLSSLKITIKVSFYNITSEASYVYFRFFLNKMNINLIDKDNDGWTHFCFAYGYGQQDVVKQFLDYQISILMRLFWKFLNTVLSRVTSKAALAIFKSFVLPWQTCSLALKFQNCNGSKSWKCLALKRSCP